LPQSGALFSPCDRYRYSLWRTWDMALPKLLIIGLNPSTADATHNDPTIRRCIGFAQSWGYGSVTVTNLFALRSPYPKALRQAQDPVGPQTDAWIWRLLAQSDACLLAWGNEGRLLGRDRAVRAQLLKSDRPLLCLKVTKQGQPSHPLYLKKTLKPTPWVPAAAK
ncbi:MAG: DUF1643 domain-containing protein, partial [Cyanobacteria bacterium P01_A01_bin.135]